ncbi:MAG: hypothetical protein HYV09_19555 [Deltaproteobacteria bacterium]|nr:hypothetical protein [Deltaproteobacteria bacterium]
MRAASLAIAALVLLVAAPRSAHARVQNSASGQLGVVGVGADRDFWAKTRVNYGLRLESVWFREGPKDFGIGPYVEARTASFGHGDYGGGLVAVLPVHHTFPLWIGGGGFARREDAAFGPGFNGFVAWGGRSFNHHGSYAMAYGLLLDGRVHRGPVPGFDLVMTASVDLQWLSYPVLYAISALRH